MATRRKSWRLRTGGAWLGVVLAGIAGCGEDVQRAATRGAPPLQGGPANAGGGGAAADGSPGDPGEVDPGPPRPPVALDNRSFSRRRDPFESYVQSEELLPEPEPSRADRRVRMARYAFEDLRLIAIVDSSRALTPRALFLASDGKSKTIRQGEYFSSAEVLLAAVNRDYVEIEVVDDDLASSLNLQRGERRAIYLRTD